MVCGKPQIPVVTSDNHVRPKEKPGRGRDVPTYDAVRRIRYRGEHPFFAGAFPVRVEPGRTCSMAMPSRPPSRSQSPA